MAQRSAASSYVQVAVAQTTSMVGVNTFAVERKVFIASDWDFLPAGLKVFKERFTAELKKKKLIAHLSWDSDVLMFEVKCSRENVLMTSQVFHRLLGQIIKEESGDFSDDEDATELYMTDSSLHEVQDVKERKSDIIKRIALGRGELPFLSDTEEEEEDKDKRSRSPSSELESEDPTSNATPTLLLANILYAEDASKLKFSINTFGQMGQRFYEMTLVDNMETLIIANCYEDLASAHTISYYSKAAVNELVSPLENKDISLQDWVNHTYPGFGCGQTRATLIESASQLRVAAKVSTSTPALVLPAKKTVCDFKLPQRQKASQKGSSSTRNPFAGRLEQPEPLSSRPASLRPLRELVPQAQDPSPEFISEVKNAFHQIMETIHNGSPSVIISVRAELGRIIVKGLRSNVASSSEYQLSAHGVQDVLFKSQIQFTQVLSVIPAEIHYLINMQSLGKNMWETTPASRTVTYQIICKDDLVEASSAFTLEVNAETKVAELKMRRERELGVVNIHGIKRLWDFRLVARQNQPVGWKLCKDFSAAILTSLWVPSGLQEPVIHFKVPESYFHFKILGVRVRRATRYNGHNTATVLNVHEIQELNLQEKAESDGAASWVATPSPVARTGEDWLDFWYEVDISSPKAEEMLKQKNWSADGLSKAEVAKELCIPACHMVKQMDVVGCYNVNGKKIEKPPALIRERKPKTQEEVIFW